MQPPEFAPAKALATQVAQPADLAEFAAALRAGATAQAIATAATIAALWRANAY